MILENTVMTDKKLNFNLSTHCVGRITRSGILSRVNITYCNNSWCWIINSSFTTIFVSCILLYIFLFVLTVFSKYFTLSFTVASFNVVRYDLFKNYSNFQSNRNRVLKHQCWMVSEWQCYFLHDSFHWHGNMKGLCKWPVYCGAL